jgi:hypothetical protein
LEKQTVVLVKLTVIAGSPASRRSAYSSWSLGWRKDSQTTVGRMSVHGIPSVDVVHRHAGDHKYLSGLSGVGRSGAFVRKDVDSSYFTVQEHANPAWFAAAMRMKSTVNWRSD